jgi:hypothetical protein
MVSRHDISTDEEDDPDVNCTVEIQDVLEDLKSITVNKTLWQ